MVPVIGTLGSNAILAARVKEISFPIGPTVYTPDGAYELGNETHRLYCKVTDQSIVHHGFMPLPLANVVIPTCTGFGLLTEASAHNTALVYWAVEIGGASWTGMPSGGSTGAVLHRSDALTQTVTDPAASASDMNSVRRMAQDLSASPVKMLPTESYMLELLSPRNGTGTGRYTLFYRVILRFAEVVTLQGLDYYLCDGDP